MPRLERVVDGASDGLLAAFALWTVAYEVAVLTESSVWALGAVWVVVATGLAVLGAATHRAGTPEVASAPDDVRDVRDLRRTPGPVTAVLVVLLVAAVVLRHEVTALPLTVLGLLVLALGVVPAARLARGPRRGGTEQRGSGVALLVCLGGAVFASFLRRSDADDAFYLNRATWVAEHGVPVVRDTMFGPETYSSTYGRGLPFPSFEALIGSLAHLLDVRAGTLAYVGVVPVLAFALLWTTWRLVRTWTSARALPVFLATVLVLVMSGHTIVGAYGFGRIWQGKVVAFAILTPLIWVYLTRTVSSDRQVARRAQVLLLLSGVAFAGLTSGAPLLVPTFAAAGLLAALLLRHRGPAVGAGLLLVGPVLAAVSVLLGAPNFTAEEAEILTADDTLTFLVGGLVVFGVLGVLAITLGVRLLRPEAVVVASCGSLVALATLLPGVVDLADAVTGAGAIAWRLVTLVPLAVLTGVLLVEGVRRVPTPTGRAVAGVAAAVGLAVAGVPLWQGNLTTMTTSPGWKVDPDALDDVEAVLELDHGTGTLLLPATRSQVLAVYTTEEFATVPRLAYVANLDDTEERISARYALQQWLDDGYPLISRGVRERLELLGVALVCVPSGDRALTEELDQVAADGVADVVPAGSLSCAVRRGEHWS